MSEGEKNNNFFVSVVKGVGFSVIISLALVLIFAFVVKFLMPGSVAIKTVNQFIKVVAIFLGCFIAVRENKGLVKGGLIGVVSTVIIYLIFSLVGGKVSFSTSFYIDLIFTLIIGAISGATSVNLRKN